MFFLSLSHVLLSYGLIVMLSQCLTPPCQYRQRLSRKKSEGRNANAEIYLIRPEVANEVLDVLIATGKHEITLLSRGVCVFFSFFSFLFRFRYIFSIIFTTLPSISPGRAGAPSTSSPSTLFHRLYHFYLFSLSSTSPFIPSFFPIPRSPPRTYPKTQPTYLPRLN